MSERHVVCWKILSMVRDFVWHQQQLKKKKFTISATGGTTADNFID